MGERRFTILYAYQKDEAPQVLGTYTRDVAFALIEEYERSGLLIQSVQAPQYVRIIQPAYARIAVDVSEYVLQ